MENGTILIAILVAAAVAVAAGFVWRSQRHKTLVRRYGPEYERVVRDVGNPSRADKELEAREKRVSGFKLRELNPEERERYLGEWARIQQLFVDQPDQAVASAHELLMALMRDRGYPDSPLEQRQQDLSVHYPHLIESYRNACAVAQVPATSGAANTERLRMATIHYRTLFNALLSDATTVRDEVPERQEVAS
jgi:hypothetical protein